MAELLIVVAIIVVLAGVAFVGVASHMRSMTKLEYDGYAKEIFVAAQNHLTMAAHEGYLGAIAASDFGTAEQTAGGTKLFDGSANPAGHEVSNTAIYYILAQNGVVQGNGSRVLKLMLPDGALADGKALSGSYIIRYHKDSARILDVFYWQENAGGWASRYNYSFNSSNANALFKAFLESRLEGLKDYSGAVIGYYGGATAGISYKSDVKAPTIKVENGDVLRVLVTNPNSSADVWVDLTVKGKSSGAVKTFTLKNTFGDGSRVTWDSSSGKHSVMLDDITNQALHFANLGVDAVSPPSFTPGEDLEITAVAYNTNPAPDTVSNVAYSNTETTNSLFKSISKTISGGSADFDTADITHIRHLENLDNSISNVSYNGPEIAVTKAVQKNSLDFLDFKNAVGAGFKITGFNTSPPLAVESFLPVNPVYALNYDGDQNSIKNIVVSGYSSDAGLFGAPTGAVSVNNLMLIDFTISGTNAGALAGTLTGGTVANVIVYNSQEKDSTFSASNPNITGTGSVGGLIGVQSGGSVTGSAAAVYVHGNTAGGFIGTMSSGTVTGCYSGGHTSGGEYKTDNYNVIGSSYSGGFVGSMSGGSVSSSYSTCSVWGGTGTAGGFAGNSAGSIRNSYCTGLVSGTSADAFAGSGTTTNCQYFSIINPEMTSSTAYAFDSDTSTYSGFANGTASAAPYDPTLTAYYKGTYNLKTVTGLGYTIPTGKTYFVSTHYGDWPAPEIFFVNTPVPTP